MIFTAVSGGKRREAGKTKHGEGECVQAAGFGGSFTVSPQGDRCQGKGSTDETVNKVAWPQSEKARLRFAIVLFGGYRAICLEIPHSNTSPEFCTAPGVSPIPTIDGAAINIGVVVDEGVVATS